MIYSEMTNLLHNTLCTFNTNHPNLTIFYDNDARRQQFVVHVMVNFDYTYAYILTYEQVQALNNKLYDYCLEMHNEYSKRRNENDKI